MNKLVIGGGIALGLIAILGFKKKSDFDTVVANMEILVDDVRNVRLKGLNTAMDVNIRVVNNSNTDFSIATGGLVKITKIALVNQQGKIIGDSTMAMDNITLPSNDSIVLKNIPIEIPAMSMIQEFGNITNFNKSNYKLQVTVQALGQEYVLEQALV